MLFTQEQAEQHFLFHFEVGRCKTQAKKIVAKSSNVFPVFRAIFFLETEKLFQKYRERLFASIGFNNLPGRIDIRVKPAHPVKYKRLVEGQP